MRSQMENNFVEGFKESLSQLTKSVNFFVQETSNMHNRFYDNTVKILSSMTNKYDLVIAYEIAINSFHSLYPDFYLLTNNKSLFIELKNTTNIEVARHINNIPEFNADEYWVLVTERNNIDHIKKHVHKSHKKIKVFKYQVELFNNIRKFML